MKINDKYLKRTKLDEEMLLSAIKNLQLSGTSDIIDSYEKKLANYWESKYAVAVSSGTAAIHVALEVLGVKKGDEVILPPTAPIMTGIPILQIGAVPIFVDTNEDDFGFCITDLRKKITDKTKAIICVPMWGYAFNYDELINISTEFDIPLIEDGAQAHGSKFRSKKIGTIGTIGCFSTHDRKLLSTGEGGFILTDNKALYDKAKKFIQFGNMTGDEFGVNYKLSTLQASIGISGIDRIDEQINIRKSNVKYLFENLKNKNLVELKTSIEIEPNYYSLVLQDISKKNIIELNKRLLGKGIPSDIVRYNYRCMYENKIFNQWATYCPKSEILTKSIMTLPVHPNITIDELNYIIEELNTL